MLQIACSVELSDVAGVQPAVGVDRGRGGLRVVEVAQHHVRPAQQHLARPILGGVVDAQLEVRDRTATGGGDGDRVVVGRAHGAEAVGLGQAVRGEHDVDVELGLHAFDEHDGNHRGAGDREPQRGQVVFAALGVVEQRLIDRRRPGQHGDAMVLHGPHGLLGVERQLRNQGGPGLQARQDSGLVTEVVEERVDAQVAVVAGDLAALGPCRRAGQRLPMRAQRALAAAGGAGREEDVGDVVGLDRRGANFDGTRGLRVSRPAR